MKEAVSSPTEALDKARRYCAVQERGRQEVRNKLNPLGLHLGQVEDTIGRLSGGVFSLYL